MAGLITSLLLYLFVALYRMQKQIMTVWLFYTILESYFMGNGDEMRMIEFGI